MWRFRKSAARTNTRNRSASSRTKPGGSRYWWMICSIWREPTPARSNCGAARALAAPKRISLSAESAPDLIYFGDEELLRRMLMNLLNNAVKYTPEDGEVRVSLKRDDHLAFIAVADTGAG